MHVEASGRRQRLWVDKGLFSLFLWTSNVFVRLPTVAKPMWNSLSLCCKIVSSLKKSSDTVLKVEFDGDFRVAFCKRCCKRWYFTFNGIECAKPAPIEGIDAIWRNHGRTDTNVHKHSKIRGYCEGIGSRTVRVAVTVGDCPGFGKGFNAYTGHKSVTRIMIEEVPKPQ